jgi:hypothetical protein
MIRVKIYPLAVMRLPLRQSSNRLTTLSATKLTSDKPGAYFGAGLRYNISGLNQGGKRDL